MPERVVFVACPLTSRGGVYHFLLSAMAELRRQGAETAVIYGSRIGPLSFPAADATVQVAAGPVWPSQQELRRAILGMVHPHTDVLISVLPQADLACSTLPRHYRHRWVAMLHGRPVPARGEQPWRRRAVWGGVLKFAYKRPAAVVAVSNALAQECRLMGLGDCISVLSSGVTIPDGIPEPRTTNQAPVVGFYGRISREKGPDIFIDVMSGLEAPGVMFGDGPLLAECLDRASGTTVQYGGWTDRATAFTTVDILVMPSRREGLGLALLEAGSYGVPVIASAVGGMLEILERDPWLLKHCVYSANPGDVSACRSVLVRHLSDPALRLEAGNRLKTVVSEHYQLDKQIGRLRKVLHDVGS